MLSCLNLAKCLSTVGSIKNIINEVYCHVAQPTLSFFIDTDIRTCIKRIMDRESDQLKQFQITEVN